MYIPTLCCHDSAATSLTADNNAVENTIRHLAIGRKNYIFCSCKAYGTDVRTSQEDTLKSRPSEKDINSLLHNNSNDYLVNPR